MTHPAQDQLIALLKQKGTGKTMSKALSASQCALFQDLLLNTHADTVTKATLLIAFFMLKNTPDEQAFFEELSANYVQRVPAACFFLFNPQQPSDYPELQRCLYQVMAGQALHETDCYTVCKACLDPGVPDIFKACLLEGLRLKEESPTENRVFLAYFYQQTQRLEAKVPLLLDIASAYDGFNRHPNLLLALAPLLASCGFPVLLHGLKTVSPKFGLTLHRSLLAFGKDPLHTMERAVAAIEDPSLGWAYCDQAVFFPALHALVSCRNAMVKRPVLATIEKFLCPIQTTGKHILVTGYTHPAYRDKTRTLLNTLPHCADYVFVRGIEGASFAPADRRCPVITKHKPDTFASPDTYNLSFPAIPEKNPAITLEQNKHAIEEALTDASSFYSRWLCYNALFILDHLTLVSCTKTLQTSLQTAITSGRAWSHFQRYPDLVEPML